jgi:hypothetical protein
VTGSAPVRVDDLIGRNSCCLSANHFTRRNIVSGGKFPQSPKAAKCPRINDKIDLPKNESMFFHRSFIAKRS